MIALAALLATLGAFGIGFTIGSRREREAARADVTTWSTLARELHAENGQPRCSATPVPPFGEPPSGAQPRTWSARIVPSRVWSAVTRDGELDFDEAWPVKVDGRWHGDVSALDPHNPHRVHRLWPQLIGLRVARRLLERGRITHAVLPDTRAARKLRTLRPAAWTDEQWGAWLDEHIVSAEGQS